MRDLETLEFRLKLLIKLPRARQLVISIICKREGEKHPSENCEEQSGIHFLSKKILVPCSVNIMRLNYFFYNDSIASK